MNILSRRTVIALCVSSFLFVGCSTGDKGSGGTDQKTYKVGITQIASHPSLDAAREGFKEALADSGLKTSYDEQNAQGDQATATSIANKFVTGKVDLIVAIATPSAQAATQATQTVPVLFTAVTDPVSAKLVNSASEPGGNITGTTDMNPVADQIGLIKQIKPNATSVGIVYSSGEVNSEVQVKAARAAAASVGLNVVEKTVTNTSEVQQAANSLQADAIYVPTDNNVVASIESVVQVAEQKKIPLITGDADSVRKGALITYGIDYYKLGQQTGQMAVKVLKGESKPATMPVEAQKEFKLVINQGAASRQGVTIPAELMSKASEVIK